jgi:predicted AlkP superfamily pyrophosphatase or phosphodiesterase
MLCSIDGMRPDALQAARAPVMHRLIREGAVCWRARTVMPSCTLPCHTSMLRGVPTERHGVTSNTFTPLVRPVPSLIDAAKDQGRRTGFFYNWEELRDLAAPGKLDVSMMLGDSDSAAADARVADMTIGALDRIDFDLVFLYFGWTDACGHRNGWMSQPYLDAIADADACLGRVLDHIQELGRGEETTTLILSDHGGHERTHGTEHDDDMLIPWILHGPGVRAGHTIEGPVLIYDTCVTLGHILGLTPRPEWEGRAIKEALISG